MATASAQFDRFKLWQYSSYALSGYMEALIYCYMGTTLVGRIEFHKAGIPDSEMKSSILNGQPRVLYRVDRFQDVYQFLLHEKPLTLFANDTNGIGGIGTDEHELIGQEE